jgi:hypothetical protein
MARKGQEGFKYTICLVAIDSSKAFTSVGEEADIGSDPGISAPVFCLNVDVQRCRYCPRSQDSFQAVAKAWHATWLEVWSGNHDFLLPDSLLLPAAERASNSLNSSQASSLPNAFNPIEVGVIYLVHDKDDLWHLALRYQLGFTDILFWNPDLTDGKAKEQQYGLVEAQELCFVPPTCVYSARVTNQPWDGVSGAGLVDAA